MEAVADQVFAFSLPAWLSDPGWWHEATRAVRLSILQHQTSGLFVVILLEEIGIPLPAPGDVAITYGGYFTTTGAIPYPLAYVAAVAGAVMGATVNLTVSRRYGRPFIGRFGRYVGITDAELARAQRIFKRWGRGRSSSAGTSRACGSCFLPCREYLTSLIAFSYRAYSCRPRSGRQSSWS